MKKCLLIFLTSLIGSALYSRQAFPDLVGQCLLSVPAYTKPLIIGDANSFPVHIQADKVVANYPEYMFFSGNVDIKQGNSTLTADEVQLTQFQAQNNTSLRTVTATGHVNYFSNSIKLQGPKAWSNLNTKDTDVYQGNYQMVGRQGRGNADNMKQRGNNRYTVLENGSFTSCLPGDDSWSIMGSEIIHDRKKEVAEIWNAYFKISNVPVFYSPYLTIPVGNKRHAGFLIPHAKYGSNNGFEFIAPYYLNLAPNYDATITSNYMSQHGIQIQTELRYLTTPGEGLVAFDWLLKDRLHKNKQAIDGDRDRWVFYWRHNGILNKVWRFNFDYTKVSDFYYFNDLDSKYGNTTDGYATQKFCFSYADKNWEAALSYKQFQVFNTNSSNAYRVVPQLDVTYYKNDVGPFNFKIFSQAAKFTNIHNSSPEAIRLHIEPTLYFPLVNRWSSFNTETKLMATYYQQKNIDRNNVSTDTRRYLKSAVNRVLPQFKTEGKMLFERDIDYAPNYTQTLEPRLQYLFVPYRNQNDIGVYDSTVLQTDYTALFRDRIYSGLDRISSSNQLAGGITTRIYDDQHVERFNASVGQIYYFLRPRTGDITGDWNDYNNTGIVVLAGDSDWRISNQWRIRGSLQYESRLSSVALCNTVLEYKRDENHILQLNYRYASQSYITQMLFDIKNRRSFQHGISQVGVIGSWSFADRWSLIGAYHYDTKANQPRDQLVALQYNTCCWSINVGYERKMTDWNKTGNLSQYNNKVSLNIELRGLSNNYNLGANKMMLASSILPYQRIF
ncbi:LPS assembly protein LptD [Candidatus Doolittlea endobia]|uniref:LPS assembly protein LptD n=1 Tax=Candidatus Doolittlea endobia TaxID=1778262 RepID=UPI0038BA4561